MRATITILIITVCFSFNSKAQSIIELSEDMSFVIGLSDISIDSIVEASTIAEDGTTTEYRKYIVGGYESYNHFSFIKDKKDGGQIHYSVECRSPQSKIANYPLNGRDWDTLFVSLDTIYSAPYGPDILLNLDPPVGGFVTILNWLSPTLGYVVLYPTIIDIAALLPIGLDQNIVFRDNINFTNKDTVYLSASEAIHEISYEGVNEDGTPLKNLLNHSIKWSLAIETSNGGTASWNTSMGNNNGLNISDYYGEIDIYFAANVKSTQPNESSYLVEFPIYDTIIEDITLTNQPENFVNAFLNFSLFKTNYYNEVGIADLKKFLSPISGNPTMWGSVSYVQIPPDSTWKTSLFLDMQDSDKFGYCLQHYIKRDGDHHIAAPHYDKYNDSLADFYEFTPYGDVRYINNNDIMYFGSGLSYYWPNWTISMHVIKCESDNEGLFGNSFYRDYTTDTHKIIDNNGNIIQEGTGLVIECSLPETGQYTIQQTNTFCPFDGYIGSSTLLSTTITTNTDRNPPPISKIQLFNGNNTLKYHFDADEDVFLRFTTSDFVYYNNHHIGTNYQAVVDSITKVSIKQHNNSEWIKVACEKIYSDSLIGFQYQAALSENLINDSAMYDLKINVQDYSGNTSELTFSPAFLYGNILVDIDDNQYSDKPDESIVIKPNPAQDYISISNIEKYNDASITFEIINISGSIVKQGLLPQNTSKAVINISDLPDGLFIITVSSMNKPLISRKIIKM